MSDKKYHEAESLKEAMWKNFYKEEDKWEGMPEADFLDVHGGCPRHWFQLGFSAGLDAVVKADPVPHEMTAGEFVRALFRLTNDFNDERWDVFCRYQQATTPDEAVAIVEAWAREHPKERSEALKEDEIKNDEWVNIGMQGACASFEDEEVNDEN